MPPLCQQQLHSRYVLQLLLETWKLLRMLPNISRISTCHSKEITICGRSVRLPPSNRRSVFDRAPDSCGLAPVADLFFLLGR